MAPTSPNKDNPRTMSDSMEITDPTSNDNNGNNNYPKLQIQKRDRSSSLAELLKHPLSPPIDTPEKRIRGTSDAQGLKEAVGSWEPEERLIPRADKVPKKSGFEMEAAKEILGGKARTKSSSSKEKANMRPKDGRKQDDVDGDWNDSNLHQS